MRRISIILTIVMLISVLAFAMSSCETTGVENTPVATLTPEQTHTAGPTTTQTVTTPTPTPTPEEPYVFPEDGVLKLLASGKAPGAVDGLNPSLAGDKIVVFFDFAFRKAGLALNENTEITYELVKVVNGQQEKFEGTTKLDTTTVPEIKNEYGYIGLCFDTGATFDKFNKGTFSLSFKDEAGKEYFLKSKEIYKGVSYLGLDAAAFDEHFKGTVKTTNGKQLITQVGTFNGTEFTFTISLSRWAGKTTASQIITVSRLFWEVYPKMYARFGALGQSPTTVNLTIEDTGYGIASAGGNNVHLHDQWLKSNYNDYDCLTHEFAHVIQNGWNGDYCQYSGYIERFADACRYLYAFQNGRFNDNGWELNTVYGESTLETSVRFVIWFDYFYSTEGNDLMVKYFDACRNKRIPASKWDQAWAYIFEGSELEGKSIDEIWKMYEESDFAKLSSRGALGYSPLLKKYNVRERFL